MTRKCRDFCADLALSSSPGLTRWPIIPRKILLKIDGYAGQARVGRRIRREALPVRLHRADIRRRRRNAEFCFQRRDARFECLVFLASQPRHVLDRLELLALDDIEVAQDFFGLIADHRIDLTLDALGGAGGVIHQAPDLVEKPIAGLGHLGESPVGCELEGLVRQWRSGRHGSRPRSFPDAANLLERRVALSCSGFLAIVVNAQIKKPRKTASGQPMIDQQVEIPTKDGHTTTFISHPERDGPHPVILFYMDAPGIREELRDMARRLATSGYYVMLPNLYYRLDVMELGPLPADPEAPERKRMFGFMNSINIPLVMEDTTALLAYADGQSAARTDIVGAVGYCMSGRYAINAATHFPGRVKAAASIYGTRLATDQPDSPHLAASKTKAELYFGCAETDIYAPTEIIEKVKASMKDAHAEVETYPGTHHGFAFPKRPVYDRDAAERHWERLLALYRRNLVSQSREAR